MNGSDNADIWRFERDQIPEATVWTPCSALRRTRNGTAEERLRRKPSTPGPWPLTSWTEWAVRIANSKRRYGMSHAERR